MKGQKNKMEERKYVIETNYLVSSQKKYYTKVIDKKTWNETTVSTELFEVLKKCDGNLHKFSSDDIEILNILMRQGIVKEIDATEDYHFNECQIKKGVKLLPRQIEAAIVHITGRCNLGCKHCYFSPHRASEELSIEDWEDVFEQVHELGVYKVQITGGEPLVREDIIEICKILKRYAFLVILTTNATLLNESFLKSLIESGVSAFGVSLDGATQETYKDFRGKDCFSTVIDNLKLIRDYRDSRKLSYFCINSMVTKKTIGELFSLYRMMTDEIKPNIWLIEKPYICGTYKKYAAEYDVDVKEMAPLLHKLLIQIQQDKPEFPYRIHLDKFYTYLNPDKYSHMNFSKVYAPYTTEDWACGRHLQHLYILPNGDVVWCDYEEACPTAIGNVRKESISEIWRKSEEFKKRLRLENFLCRNCEYVRYCGGGCRLIPIVAGEGIQGCDRDFRYYVKYGMRRGLYESIKNKRG